MYSVELVDGKAFSAEDGETLLDAASRSCVDLNYSCKSGRCNACKCKVLNGSTKSLRPEAGLTEDEKNGGISRSQKEDPKCATKNHGCKPYNPCEETEKERTKGCWS